MFRKIFKTICRNTLQVSAGVNNANKAIHPLYLSRQRPQTRETNRRKTTCFFEVSPVCVYLRRVQDVQFIKGVPFSMVKVTESCFDNSNFLFSCDFYEALKDSEYPKTLTLRDSKYLKNLILEDSKHRKTLTLKDSKYSKNLILEGSEHPNTPSPKDSKHPKSTTSKDSKHPKIYHSERL